MAQGIYNNFCYRALGYNPCRSTSLRLDGGSLVAKKPKSSNKSNKKSASSKKKSSDRELIDTGTDKRYVRRDEKGRFTESNDAGRSLAQDVRKHAKTGVKSG